MAFPKNALTKAFLTTIALCAITPAAHAVCPLGGFSRPTRPSRRSSPVAGQPREGQPT